MPMLTAPSIAPEFQGRARSLRSRMLADDLRTNDAIDRITGRALARRRRHPVPRPEHLSELARRWRVELPLLGRLDLRIDSKRKSLAIDELRVGASSFRGVGWVESEPGVSVMGLALRIAPDGVFSFERLTLATVSQHALGRRYERGWSVSDADVLSDLHQLARAYDSLIDAKPGSDFTLPLRSGGRWVGSVTAIVERNTPKSRILNVRSFLD